MANAPLIDAPRTSTTRFEYLVVPLKEAKSIKNEEVPGAKVEVCTGVCTGRAFPAR
jgi:hypothetical protein